MSSYELMRYTKHNLQNKLHRCADPGDLIKLDQLVERIDREGGYSQAFVRELKLFQAPIVSYIVSCGDEKNRMLIHSHIDTLTHRHTHTQNMFMYVCVYIYAHINAHTHITHIMTHPLKNIPGYQLGYGILLLE